MKKLLLILSFIPIFTFGQLTINGNSNTGFGGVFGAGSLSISHSGNDINITFNRGTGDFNDFIVLYRCR